MNDVFVRVMLGGQRVSSAYWSYIPRQGEELVFEHKDPRQGEELVFEHKDPHTLPLRLRVKQVEYGLYKSGGIKEVHLFTEAVR